ncbi:Cloroperoxidase [Byssothecium circinans]|uniref:Cloroperoxidase n=1 Tax=Byssothecium circinans TaxID=147558 RepID=A0A6A5TJ32_9PLEO|nr:Cloroperoxidase [Byssothecium circinans]
MKLQTILSIIGLMTLAKAQFEDWQHPLPTDSRAPCPGLNALANHGILPRDGRNLTVPVVVAALGTLNVSAETATGLASQALLTSSNPAGGVFNLEDLKKHGILEHDGSLSRKDAALGGANAEFDQETFNEFLGYFNGSDQITLASAAAARWGRLTAQRKRNPTFSYTPNDRFGSYAETAIYVSLFRDAATGTVPLERVKIFFTEERFPWAEGWRPVNRVTGLSAANIILNLALNTPEDPVTDIVMPTTAAQ